MKYPVRFRKETPDDISAACLYYESCRTGLSNEFVRELKATLSRVSATPEAYAKGERDVRAARLHRFPYVVHFRFTGTVAVILAVMFGGRDTAAWQDRE